MSRKRSKYDRFVDNLLKENESTLIQLGRKNYKQYRKNRSDGEKFIAKVLQELNYRYVPEFITSHLKGDKKAYRAVDFYLPKENIYLEYCGMWDGSEEEKERYREKRKIYENNEIKHIFVYPKNLKSLSYHIILRNKLKILKIMIKRVLML